MKIALPLRVRYLINYDHIMENAGRIGAENGRDQDTLPSSLSAAVLEILLFGMSAVEDGVIFLPSNALDVPHNTLTVPTYLTYKPEGQNHHSVIANPPFEWPNTLIDNLTGGANSPDSPSDMGFEIDDSEFYGPAPSAHQIIADRQACETALYTGPIPECLHRTMFATREVIAALREEAVS